MSPATYFHRPEKTTFLNRRFYTIFTVPLTICGLGKLCCGILLCFGISFSFDFIFFLKDKKILLIPLIPLYYYFFL
jgi:hypothetical protein